MAESSDHSSPRPSTDHNLPPVEEPNPRFIVQLFIVPAVIVVVLVLGYILLGWFVNRGSDPTQYVQALRRPNEARWQAAASLADVLNNPRNVELKRDRRLAEELAALLSDELKSDKASDQQTMLKVFLCRALGEFELPEALPPLVSAAKQDKPEDVAVRRAAIEALAVLASHLDHRTTDEDAALRSALLPAAADKDGPIRSASAYALGVMDDEVSREQLKQMLRDLYPDVRYNAATGLVRHNDPAAMPVLLEMLDPEELEQALELIDRAEPSPERKEAQAKSREFRKNLMLTGGLQSATAVAAAHPELDVTALRKALERLARDDQPADIRIKAAEALRTLDARAVPAEATR